MVSWVVFDGDHRVCRFGAKEFRSTILAISETQAVEGFRHTRYVEPGNQGYAITLADLIGGRDIDESAFRRSIRPGMTEEEVRGIPELGRTRQTRP